MSIQSRMRRGSTLAVALAIALVGLPGVALAVDTTPPTGKTTYWNYHRNETIEFRLAYSDPESGLATIDISCDGGPEATYSYVTKLIFKGMDPEAGGCTTFGGHWFEVRVTNGQGLSVTSSVQAETEPIVHFEYPLAPRTGQPFTIRPVYSEGYTVPSTAKCRWEFRWGSTPALRDNEFDETFGGMLFEGPASKGFCGEWTFTLPWVPVPQFELDFEGPGKLERTGTWPDRELIQATVSGTDRRIRESNLPIAQILPNTYSPVVGEPITYTRYLVGGAKTCCNSRWFARLGTGENPIVWEKWTSASTFTFTPPTTGPLFVGWNHENPGDLLTAYYDPPVRRRDTTRPNSTKPVETVGGGALATTVPITLRWSGTDVGWGIGSYKLQQSVDDGAWKTIALPRPKSTSIVRFVTVGTPIRYRVRAIDDAGNRSTWDYGPTFKPRVVEDSSTGVDYRRSWSSVTDPTAHGGGLRESATASAKATFAFRGRDIAWVAERGPGHGKAKVYVDGRLVRTVNLAATGDSPRRVVFQRHWAAVGNHSIRIEVVGNGIVSLDAFVVLR